jgi:hypothetical protein
VRLIEAAPLRERASAGISDPDLARFVRGKLESGQKNRL